MAYEYRRLTPEEREEVLRLRREAGYPLHSPPHPFRGPAHYLITAANYEHAAIMAPAERRTEFEAALLETMRSIGAEVSGWVILANHYHIIVAAQSLDDVAGALRLLHGRTSRAWNVQDGQTGNRRVWYRYADQVVRNEDHFYRVLNYIHVNPVKHGYIDDPYEWPWSSVHLYYETHGREWLRQQWKAHPPGDMGRGWDV